MTRILLTGLPGAGKSTVAQVLESLGRPRLNVGDALQAKLCGNLSFLPRDQIGPRYLTFYPASSIFPVAVRAARNQATVFDGVRLALTCSQFQAATRHVRVWYVEADRGLREQRLGQLNRSPGFHDYADQQLIIRPLADVIVRNEGSLSELEDAVARLLVKAR